MADAATHTVHDTPFDVDAIVGGVSWTSVLPAYPVNEPGTSLPFRVVSYNVLAYVYTDNNRANPAYQYLVPFVEARQQRDLAICELLLMTQADIICLQEVELNSSILARLTQEGYRCVYTPRPKDGNTADHTTPDTGIATCVRRATFELMKHEDVPLNNARPVWPDTVPLDRRNSVNRLNNCGSVCVLDSVCARPLQFSICVGNIHAYWNPAMECVKVAQAQLVASYMQSNVYAPERKRGPCAMIFAGDFNSVAYESETYRWLTDTQNFKSSYAAYRLFASAQYRQAMLPFTAPEDAIFEQYKQKQEWLRLGFAGEPMATNVTYDFAKTIDYIFYQHAAVLGNAQMQLIKLLDVPLSIERYRPAPSRNLPNTGIPDARHPSDHFPIGAEFTIVKV